ncbi:MAG: YdbL family protein [Pseudomonadales bacterium]|nr:YdbL family protein [Pseudomonadales bacterium]
MKNMIVTILLCILTHSAWAIELADAKAQGLVGEANSGYIAAVKQPVSADVKALVNEVNTKRKALFQRAANKTGISTSQVSDRSYELAVERTARGHYYQNKAGDWVKK